MRLLYIAIALFATASFASPLRLNQIQVIGTHNSYHQQPEGFVIEVARMVVGDEVDAWNYSHPPLDVQLQNGVRNFELDLHAFADGWEVQHVPIYDPLSSCPQLSACLQSVKDWSDLNPGHVPVSFLFEIKEKETILSPRPQMTLDAKALAGLDELLLSVFPRERILTPDEVRGDAATLREAVTTNGWPELDEVRGKVMFVLHERGALRDAYTEGTPNLEGRVMFTNSKPDRPDCAVIVVDNPYREELPEFIREGYITRVRADSGLGAGKTGDTKRRDQALASGAQIVSTDFPPGSPAKETGYVVAFEGGKPARCNPINAPENCELP
jgi:hypothetical protein